MKKILIITLIIQSYVVSAAQFTQEQYNQRLYPTKPNSDTEKYRQLFEESEANRAEIFKAAGLQFGKKELNKQNPTAYDYQKALERSQALIKIGKEELKMKLMPLPAQSTTSISSDSTFTGDTIDPDNNDQDDNQEPASSGWMSSLWSYGASKASNLSNALSYAKNSLGYIKSGASTAAHYATKVASDPATIIAAALYTTGAGNRLANVAGWKYDKMSDYPYAKKGNYIIEITFPSLSKTNLFTANPLCRLSFKNNKLDKNELDCDLYTVNHTNKSIKAELIELSESAQSPYDTLYAIFQKLFHTISSRSSRYSNDEITLHIDVGIEDESGMFGNRLHLFNRRWLSPITTYFPLDKDNFQQWFNNLYKNELKQRIMP